MALSGLNCPKCNGPLFDQATSCHQCKKPMKPRHWRRAERIAMNKVIADQHGDQISNIDLLEEIIKNKLWFLKRRIHLFFRRQIINF